jgi:hypothetical protein
MLLAVGLVALAPAPAGAATAIPRPPRTVYAVTFTANSALYRLGPRSHTKALEGYAGVSLTDITFRRRTLYAISFSDLYSLNATTGASHLIGPLGVTDANALATQPGTNTVFAAGLSGRLFKVNVKTGHATLVGAFGHGYYSSGDLTFARGHLYGTVMRSGSAPSLLVRINTRTGAAKLIGNTGYRDVYGLVTGAGDLYGATYGGSFLAISAKTGRARLIWKDRLAVGGLAVPSS